jgi:DNA invertase Pin-like site-specific DNA recombinase
MSNTNASQIAAVAYAAKSTEDAHGSIPAQFEAIAEAIEREGEREVVADYHDEAISGYRQSRGGGLQRALDHAERLAADGRAVELWVAHSDRLARGDGKRAMHVVEYVLWAMKADVRLRSVADDHALSDVLHGALMGARNFEDSAAKSAHTRRGKRARFERGESTGPLHFGYRLVPKRGEDGEPKVGREGRVEYQRVRDPEQEPTYLRAVGLAEQGHTYGDIARRLNAEGLRTQRGGTWATRRVRAMLTDPYYAGLVRGYGEVREGEHYGLIERGRWEALQRSLRRDDPIRRRQRRPGRRPASADYLLKGVLVCARCGTGMYTRQYAAGRTYLCGAVRESRGTCDLPRIAADLVERPTLAHLRDGFGLHLHNWIEERIAERDGALRALEAELDRVRRTLAERQRDRASARANGAELMARRPDLAEQVMDAQAVHEQWVSEQAKRVQEVEDALAAHDGVVSTDALLDRYRELRDLVDGRLRRAKDAPALNAALRSLLAYADVDVDNRGRIALQFHLAVDDPQTWPEGQSFEFGTRAAPQWIRRPDYIEAVSTRPRAKLDPAPSCRSTR